MGSVRLENVVKHFGPTRAVDNVSFAIEGRCLALLGPSGCGKTTTMNIIAGFLRPDAGAVIIDGKLSNDTPPHRRNTGLVFQDYALFPHKTVVENVGFGLLMRKLPRAEIETRVRAILSLVGLEKEGGRYPHQLSGGQRQRVALARALVIEPSVLLLDEPLSNLDARLRDALRQEIRDVLDRTKTTAIFVTHDQSEAFAVADQIALMNQGHIVQLGTARDLYQRPASAFAARFFGDCNFLTGRVKSDGGGMIAAEVAGAVVQAPIAHSLSAPKVGEIALVAVRPEHLGIGVPNGAVEDSCHNVLPATLCKVQHFGSVTKLHVRLVDGCTLMLERRGWLEDITVGESLRLHWPMMDGFAFKDEAGYRP